MIQIPLKSLAGRLNPSCRRGLEQAIAMCQSQTNYEVEIEHWMLKLIDLHRSDLSPIFSRFDVDVDRLRKSLLASVERLRRGSGDVPVLSQSLVDWVTQGWLAASLHFGWPSIRTGHLVLALLADEALQRDTMGWGNELSKIPIETLKKDFATIVGDSAEDAEGASVRSSTASPSASVSDSPADGSLDQFTIDLTQLAQDGKIDPVIGRDDEIRQVIDILMRRRQNNPILTGEAGVGKTAVVEGFAQRIADGQVPPALRNVAVRTLDLGALQAGSGVRGEFENRVKGVIDEIKASPVPVILFIDEAHMIIGAGGIPGQGDAANLLKPALARGELRTIAATTWAEYKKYFEKDAALERRFQVVKVEEPDEAAAVTMMRGLAARLESHFGVEVLDEAVEDAVRLSKRYMAGRQLPDKAVSLLDTSCARVALLTPPKRPRPGSPAAERPDGLGAEDEELNSLRPPALEECEHRIRMLEVERARLAHEHRADGKHADRLSTLEAELQTVQARRDEVTAQLQQEHELVRKIRTLRDRLSGHGSSNGTVDELSDDQRESIRADYEAAIASLRAVQGEHPLLKVFVDSQAIAEVVAGWTGVPVGRMVSGEIEGILSLRSRLRERIIGQDHAIDAIAERIRTSRAGLADPRRPTGVFLFVGTSGVGKTETALALADLVYGSEENMTVINMSEFKEEHKVSMLMGAPPGYVGYGEGGVLTEAVRRRPYSVILLDEMEKAHPGVQDVFYQAFDKGTMKDGEGRNIDFRNSLIIMTSNAASDEIHQICEDPDTRPEPTALVEAVYPSLLKVFKPAFLGRCSVVAYYPLARDAMRTIVELQLRRIGHRLADQHRASFKWDPAVVEEILDRCNEASTGARNVENVLSRVVLPMLSTDLLGRIATGEAVERVAVQLDDDGQFACAIE